MGRIGHMPFEVLRNPEEVISFKEARQRLKVAAPVFEALLKSKLLGAYDPAGWIQIAGVEDYERYGTQWSTDVLGERMLSAEFVQNMAPPPLSPGGEEPPDTRSIFDIGPDMVPDADPESLKDKNTGWIAHFYLRPNRLYWPAPTTLGMIEPLLLKLAAPKKVPRAALPTCLYPDPSGSLAMISVTCSHQPMSPISKVFETAYEVAGPILDELSVRYDQPLPIAHTLFVGIPTGLMNTFSTKAPKIREIERDEEILPGHRHPELRPAAALYREGASSNNPFHSFLAFWKVYESVLEVRSTWRKEHKRKDRTIREEVFPNLFAFGEVKGLNFEQARQRLERPYRVALAHGGFIKDGGDPRTAGSAKDVSEVSSQVPIVRYMARLMLENFDATLNSSKEGAAE